MKDGKPVPKNDHFSIEESEDGTVALLIDKVGPSDAGQYSIVATNEDGEARSEAPVTSWCWFFKTIYLIFLFCNHQELWVYLTKAFDKL